MRHTSEDEESAEVGASERRRRLRRAAVVAGVPVGAYLVLATSSLLGGPRLGASLIPLPHPAGPDVVQPVAAPEVVRTPIGGTIRPEPPSAGLSTARPTTPPSSLPSPGRTVDASGRPITRPGETCPPPLSPGDQPTNVAGDSLAADQRLVIPPRTPGLPPTGPNPRPTSGSPTSGPTSEPTAGPPSTSGPVVPPPSRPSNPSPSPSEPPADPTLTGTLLDLLNGLVDKPAD